MKKNKKAPRTARRAPASASKGGVKKPKAIVASKVISKKKGSEKPVKKLTGKAAAQSFEAKALKLIQKGRDRGFVTYDEILKEFPQIENDIIFLDDLYNRLSTANVDVLEGGGLLEIEEVNPKKAAGHHRAEGSRTPYSSRGYRS